LKDSNILKGIRYALTLCLKFSFAQVVKLFIFKLNLSFANIYKKQCMVSITTFKSLALAFPEVVELPHFEKTSFRINNKIFVTLDTNNEKACLKLNEIDQSVFSAINVDIIYPVNNKWGIQGWTIVELKNIKKNLLKDVLLKAYNTVAKKNIH
jgi:hypothetical protein